jgi:catechol 2,3-dioxygenase-like lactoylglutathione lyase family enzyme
VPREGQGNRRTARSSFAALVPEFVVGDLATSLCFWCDVLGFRVAYQRSEDNFAYLERGRAQVMLEVSGGNWQTGDWERPLGRGINFQILVESLQPLIDALAGAKWPLFHAPHDAWYRIGDQEGGLRQFLVQDPDGYLLRFAQPRASADFGGGQDSRLIRSHFLRRAAQGRDPGRVRPLLRRVHLP